MRTRVLLRFTLILPVLAAAALLLPIVHAQDGDCTGLPSARLTPGGRATVTVAAGQALRLRDSAGLDGTPVGGLENGDEIGVLDATPVCVDGVRWWQIQTEEGLIAWAAEAHASGYLLTPARIPAPTPNPADTDCSDVLPPIGRPGDQLVVTYVGQPVVARMLPAVGAGRLGEWWAGNVFTVISGPSCGSGRWWQRVSLPDGRSGWIALGDSVQYDVAVVGGTATPTPTPTPRSR